MADRRMLWKNVCRSRKVNSLSDQAALLWTWAIPWFDRDGYLEVEADFLLEMIFPKRQITKGRVNAITEKIINELLMEIFAQKLWIPYKNKDENKLFAFDPKFKKYQKVQYDREAYSSIKENCTCITLEELQSTQDLIQSTPPTLDKLQDILAKDKINEVKLREVKLSKSKEEEYEEKPKGKPAWLENQNQKPFIPNCSEEQRHQIETLTMELTPTWHQCPSTVKNHILTAHPEAIIKALTAIKNNQVADKYKYFEKIISIESGNLRAADYSAEQQKINAEFAITAENFFKGKLP
jgi:hypothetical protein